jgi:hypothetical protein
MTVSRLWRLMGPAATGRSLAPIVNSGDGMRIPGRRSVRLVRWRPSPRAALLFVAAFFAQTTSGCLSNEYRIQKDELRRLAELPPETRGHSVRVSQTLGERRSDAVAPSIDAPGPAPSPSSSDAFAEEQSADGDVSPNVDVDVDIDLDAGGRGQGRGAPPASGAGHASPPGAWRGTTPGASHAPPAGGFRGTPPGAFHGTPSGAGHATSGGGGFNLGGGGGGSGDGGALVVLAVVLVVGAALATIALAASEGDRYEGHARLTPRQTIYLVSDRGRSDEVPLGYLTPEQANRADSGIVKDDEGDGLKLLDTAPLDRTGGVFRFDLGGGLFTFGDARASGFSAHIQGGYYFTNKFGLVLDLGLGVATLDECCVGTLAAAGAIGRHSLSLEAEALPLALGRLHAGAFAGGGVALTSASGPLEAGPMASAGALLEIDLTSHMAFTLRGAANAAWFDSGLSTAGTITGGLAIY